MNPDWYGSSVVAYEAPPDSHVIGYAVWATSKEFAPYLCKALGRLWPPAADAYAWLNRMLPVPGGVRKYQVVELREVAR